MQEFQKNNIQSGLIKDILRRTPIPNIPTVRLGDYIIADCYYLYGKEIIKATKTGVIGTGAEWTAHKPPYSRESLYEIIGQEIVGNPIIIKNAKDILSLKTNYPSSSYWMYGKNLLPSNLESTEINGVTITKNEDGTYTLNGTPTKSFSVQIGSQVLSKAVATYVDPNGNRKTKGNFKYKLSGVPFDPLDLYDSSLEGYTEDLNQTELFGKTEENPTVIEPLMGKTLIQITQQPQDFTGRVGEQASFSVQAKGVNLTYQWQYKSATSPVWRNSTASSAKTNTLSFQIAAYHVDYVYRCVISDGNSSVSSNSANLITIQKLSIVQQPTDCIAVLTQKQASFYIACTGFPLSYQWQTKPNDEAEWEAVQEPSAQFAALTFDAKMSQNGARYRCVVTDGIDTVQSDEVTLSVTFKPLIVNQPQDATARIGQTAVFNASVMAPNTVTYEWQEKENKAPDTSWTTISTRTSRLSLTVTSKHYNTVFRLVVTEPVAGEVISQTVKINIID